MNISFEASRIGIVARNSIPYLDAVFGKLSSGSAVVNLRSETDWERIQLTGVEHVLVPREDTGWVRGFDYRFTDGERIAQILFSSGTEGAPKAVLLSHRALADTTRRLVDVMQMDASVLEYVGVPVHYSFGFGRCRAISHTGGSMYIPPHGFDPVELSTMLQRGQVNAVSAVPSLWRIVLQHEALFTGSGTGERVRWIEIGSQYMSAIEKTRLCELFPRARIVQHYGLTEASRSTFLVVNETRARHLESVGCAHGTEVRINVDGHIELRGPHIASGKIADGAVVPLVDEEGWLHTGDLGHLEDEHLYFDGRADDQINCAGLKLSPDAIESRLLRELGVDGGIAVAKAPDQLRGETVLVVHLYSLLLNAREIRTAAARVLQEFGLELGNALLIQSVMEIPVTSTGKVQRKMITESWRDAEPIQGVPSSPAATLFEPELTDDVQKIIAIWKDVLKVNQIGINDRFFDLGGDSLSAISAVMRMEQAGLPQALCQQILQGRSIAEITNSGRNVAPKTSMAVAGQAVDLVRGVLALIVVASHWVEGAMERLPRFMADWNAFFSPLYSAGTPGFAVVFGVGLGFYSLPAYLRDEDSVRATTLRNAFLLGAGILALSLIKIAAGYARGEPLNGMHISNSLWGVLTYYFAVVLTVPVWLKVLSRWPSFMLACLAASLVCYSIHVVISDLVRPAPSTNPFVQPLILLLTAKYNYFEMTAGVLVGAASGDWLRRRINVGEDLSPLWIVGMLLGLFSVLLSWEMGDFRYWLVWPKGVFLWSWIFYFACVLVGIAITFLWLRGQEDEGRHSTLARVLSIVGVLAFPLFVTHEMVRPLRDLLVLLGVPLPLGVSLAVFFLTMGILTSKLYRIYFAAEKSL